MIQQHIMMLNNNLKADRDRTFKIKVYQGERYDALKQFDLF